MAIVFKPAEQVGNEIESEWQTAGLINTDSASVLTTIIFPYQTHIAEMFSKIFEVHQAHRISSASGVHLDEKAREFGVARKTNEPAADFTFGNFRFRLPNGFTAKDFTFDRTGFTITAGQYITDGVATFVTLDNAVFDADSHSAYARVQGLSNATSYIPEGTLTQHSVNLGSIDELDLNTSPEISCTNDKPIELASFLEDDNSLRDRLYDRVNSNGTNEQAIEFALKTLGILDVDFVPDAFGVGTLGISLITGEPVVSETTVSAADAVISSITPYARVMVPEYIVVKLILNVEVEDESLLEETKSDIIAVVRTHIDDIPEGNELNITGLGDIIEGVDNVTGYVIRCMFLNERKSVLSTHRSASDQKYILSREGDAVTFTS